MSVTPGLWLGLLSATPLSAALWWGIYQAVIGMIG